MMKNSDWIDLEMYVTEKGKKYFVDGVEVPFSWGEGKKPFRTKIYLGEENEKTNVNGCILCDVVWSS